MKNVILPKRILDGASLSTSLTSQVIDIRYLDNVGIQIVLTGASNAVGVFDVQVSNDHTINADGSTRDAGAWISLPAVSETITSGSPSPIFLDLNQLGAAFIQLIYTRTSGTGTVVATLTSKGV